MGQKTKSRFFSFSRRTAKIFLDSGFHGNEQEFFFSSNEANGRGHGIDWEEYDLRTGVLRIHYKSGKVRD